MEIISGASSTACVTMLSLPLFVPNSYAGDDLCLIVAAAVSSFLGE